MKYNFWEHWFSMLWQILRSILMIKYNLQWLTTINYTGLYERAALPPSLNNVRKLQDWYALQWDIHLSRQQNTEYAVWFIFTCTVRKSWTVSHEVTASDEQTGSAWSRSAMVSKVLCVSDCWIFLNRFLWCRRKVTWSEQFLTRVSVHTSMKCWNRNHYCQSDQNPRKPQ